MKRTIALAATALLLAGCGGDSKPSPTPQNSGGGVDIAYLDVMHKTGEFPNWPDASLVRLAHGACDLLDLGGTQDKIIADLQSADTSPQQLKVLVRASAVYYCPSHLSETH